LERAPLASRTVKPTFVQHGEFATATGNAGPQTELAGQLHIDVQHTGTVKDFDSEALKQKVMDFLGGIVAKHHDQVGREPIDPRRAFQAFDVRGKPVYPAIHFRAICDEVTDAKYLIDQLHVGSSMGEATFSV